MKREKDILKSWSGKTTNYHILDAVLESLGATEKEAKLVNFYEDKEGVCRWVWKIFGVTCVVQECRIFSYTTNTTRVESTFYADRAR